MGLGKTVQALALLEERRLAKSGASLVVVPRSLLFNWRQEATRFTPAMRVLVHEGRDRTRNAASFAGYDLVLVTYGTLRRDAPLLGETEFDYVILDEAQAIKNSTTETAKASRLLRAKHRLAMSGTPVENRIADLWSLFEFLNPGMLGAARVFKTLGTGEESESGRSLIARAVRPFILRRTKEEVAPELPEKLEQTIYVELEPKERKRYDEMRDHYRASLLGRIDKDGIAKSKIQILEALLRLRQAACHSGLLDEKRVSESSSKFDLLIPQLAEIVAEGHKALVFSQFTSLLALLRPQLDREKVVYEYLDGQTRDREERVARFQTDPACGVFLISLKAGGLGLNLTAADYVFLLDPWWNPAVEAQAIDRTHRIGQTRRVFASRLIARDTVEEKVLELQQSKRDLAEAIIGGDSSLIARIRREDLEVLLG
jgi:SNF2 family DNA or RNA helicase